MDLIQFIKDNWQAVMEAPLAFVILGVGAYLLASAHVRSRFEDRIKLRDDQIEDWKRKTEGGSPDEARARLDALEAQVQTLIPRRLSLPSSEALTRTAAAFRGTMQVCHDGGAPSARPFAVDLMEAFGRAGWKADPATVFGPSTVPTSGLAVFVADPANLNPAQNAAYAALNAAGLQFETHAGSLGPEGRDMYLLVTSRD